MRSISSRLRPKLWLVQASGLILLFGVFATTFASWMEEKRLTVFSASSTFSVDIIEADSQEYVSLNDVLAPLGQLEISAGNNKIRLHFNSVEAQFENRESTANIGGHSTALGGRAIVEENRALVPLTALAHVLPRILSTRADYHQASHRLFLGGKSISVMPAPAVSSDSPSASPAGQEIATGPPDEAPAPQPSANPGSTPASTENPVTIAPVPPLVRYLIAIDASHGGNEPGAALGQQLLEKDVTLAIARKLRSQLQVRGLNSVMVRDDDTTVSLDDRAALANTSQAAVYIALHAGNLGRGVRVYTSTLSSADASPGLFVPWEKVQANFVRSSQVVASVIVDEFTKNATQVPVALFPAPVRPLNNVAAAALAVEVAPLRGNVESLTNSSYQDAVAEALAAALSTVRPKIEASQ